MHHMKLMQNTRGQLNLATCLQSLPRFGYVWSSWVCSRTQGSRNALKMIGKLVCIASLGFGVVDKSLLDLKLHNRRHFVLCTLMRLKLIEIQDMPMVQWPTGHQSCLPCTPHTMTHVLQLWYIGQEALDLEAAYQNKVQSGGSYRFGVHVPASYARGYGEANRLQVLCFGSHILR